MRALVTGGSGYFGERLSSLLASRGYQVRIFDLNPPATPGVEYVAGDIRDMAAVERAVAGADVIYHNVAQVPLARDRHLFWSVNRDGTRLALDAARSSGARKFVYTSSSAVFGAPDHNPVTEATPPAPAEDYGRAKLAGEDLCREAAKQGLDVTIIRPRTIIGHGRLGVVEVLFDWISRGLDVPVFDGGTNVYQFVHADDLANACILAGERPGSGIYNIGAAEFGTMRELLESVIRHAGSKSAVRSVPMKLAQALMTAASGLGLSPLGPYHSLMYGRSLYFDIGKAVGDLGWYPQWTQTAAICQSYDWYIAHRGELGSGRQRSHHQSPTKKGLLAAVPFLLKAFPRA